MKKTLDIRIESEEGVETIIITDSLGNQKTLRGVVVVGSNYADMDFYMSAAGNAKLCAKAFGEGMARGLYQEQFTGDNFYTIFYQTLLAEMCRRTGTVPHNEITSEDALKMFEKDGGKKVFH